MTCISIRRVPTLLAYMLIFQQVTMVLSSAPHTHGEDLSPAQKTILCQIEHKAFIDAERALLRRNAHLPEAWNQLQLGIIYTALKQWDAAERTLKKAKTMRKNYAEAYYALGRLYQRGPFLLKAAYKEFYWGLKHNPEILDAYYQKARIRMIERGYIYGLSDLEPLILHNPAYKQCYTFYSRLCFAFHEHNKLMHFLPKLIACYPDSSRFIVDYIHILYRKRKYSKAATVLKQHSPLLCRITPALYYLNLARIQSAQQKDTLAWKNYKTGVANITTHEDANAFFKDVQYIVTDEEYDSFMRLPHEEKKEWLHICWKSRDPTLTTDFNERFIEHYHRVRYAFRYCRRWPEQRLPQFFMDDFEDPDAPADLWMNRLGKSKGARFQQLVDDAGVTYIRHGRPDKFYSKVQPDKFMNLSWYYRARGDRPHMAFHFWRSSRKLASRPKRVQLGWIYRVTPLYPGDWTLDHSAREVMQSIETGTSTTTTLFSSKHPISFDWDSFLFRHQDVNGRMLMFYRLPEKILLQLKSKGGTLTQTLVLFDGQWRERGRRSTVDHAGTLSIRNTCDGLRRQQIIVPPGQYFVGFNMHYSLNGAEGNTKFVFNNPFKAKGLNISSVMMANEEENRPLLQQGPIKTSQIHSIQPNLLRVFQKSKGILIYFELYNLLINMKEKTDATLTLSISRQREQRSLLSKLFNRRNEWTKVSLTHEIDGQSETEYFLQAIAMPSYKTGKYTLEVSVLDRNSGRSVQKHVHFKIE